MLRKTSFRPEAMSLDSNALPQTSAAELSSDSHCVSLDDSRPFEPGAIYHYVVFWQKGLAKISAKDLLESCLRMRPDRILLQELRDGSAFYYIRNVN